MTTIVRDTHPLNVAVDREWVGILHPGSSLDSLLVPLVFFTRITATEAG